MSRLSLPRKSASLAEAKGDRALPAATNGLELIGVVVDLEELKDEHLEILWRCPSVFLGGDGA
jgi:hypothetical protein